MNELFKLADSEYKKFMAPLIPTVPKDTIIGIRIPVLRKYAKSFKGTDSFMSSLPHRYFEENNLHAFLIEQINDFDDCISALNVFLPYVDNWATCDSLRPKCFKKNLDKLLACIDIWLDSKHTYTVRFGIQALMLYFLDGNFDKKYLDKVAAIKSDEYYINMMIAWYFATALAKQYSETVKYLETPKLSPLVHNKTIQKACESFRVTNEQKQYLKTLKI
ncbi:MAG: DNA alkylation repair protein [Ruminococcaceae bacterium]|nr:DNA alkylation repair protein [Oscillospiraceae bacterium]